jgi:hypothetical protein
LESCAQFVGCAKLGVAGYRKICLAASSTSFDSLAHFNGLAIHLYAEGINANHTSRHSLDPRVLGLLAGVLLSGILLDILGILIAGLAVTEKEATAAPAK